MLLRSRILVPVTAPPIEDGGVWARDGRVAAAGKWLDVQKLATAEEVVDLGDVILLPGLVNAHAHLEYTGMAGKFTGAGGFAEWVRSINSAKEHLGEDAASEQWMVGAAMLVDSGTTTVADTQTVFGATIAKPTLASLRVIPLIEMTGVISRRAPAELLAEAESLFNDGITAKGFSPHSPYATWPTLLELTARRALESKVIVSIHVAESAEEFEMFVHRQGPLYELIGELGRPMTDCDGRTPLQHVARCGMLQKNTLLVHANYLTDKDVLLLAASDASVVHCPGSHAFFGHQPFRYAELSRRGVNICLGTDSLATMNGEGELPAELNMMAEMRRFREKHPDVAARDTLAMATSNGARALQLEDQIGSLQTGRRADMITIPYGGRLEQAEEAVLQPEAKVEMSFIGGRRIK